MKLSDNALFVPLEIIFKSCSFDTCSLYNIFILLSLHTPSNNIPNEFERVWNNVFHFYAGATWCLILAMWCLSLFLKSL